MKANFKQQFQDSQACFSQMQQSYYNNIENKNNSQQGYPIQLARINQKTKKIQLDPKALDLICENDLPIGFVTFVGRYRIGKSCLLNRMLNLKGDGFKVSNTIKQCTKGIWMWSKPFYSLENQCYLYFMDTQGTEALQKQTQIDTKLFTLNCLISSYLVFNSVGNIDQRSIEQLNLVTHLTKTIMVSDDVRKKQNQEQLHQHLPKFMWLLRDFTLQLKDQHNLKQTPTQYLQKCLKTQSSSLQSTSNTVKNQIIKLFTNRSCFTLVRPVDQQYQLQHLNQLPDHQLRLKFIQGVNTLKDTIFKNAQPKSYYGKQLYGDEIVSMLQHYVQTMNSGALPKIKTAWEHIAEDQGVYAYNRALERYNQIYSQKFKQDKPLSSSCLHQILTKLRIQTQKQFTSSLSQPNQKYLSKLHQYLQQKQHTIISVNSKLSQVQNIQILKQLSLPLIKKIQSGFYNNKSKKKQITKDIDQVVRQYNEKAIGQNKGDIITEFLMTLNSQVILAMVEDENKENNKPKMSGEAMEEFQKRQKIMEQQLNSLKAQVDSKDALIKKKQKQLIQAKENIKKKQAQKSCCLIM